MTVDRIRPVALGAVLIACVWLTSCSRPVDVLQDAAKAQALFDFHSDAWVNLHHVLYEEALRRHPQRDGSPSQSLLPPTQLTPDELAAWATAVSYYDKEFIVAERDLLFDDGLRQIEIALTQPSGESQLSAQVPQALRAALQSAAPVYTKHWWPMHDASNRQVVASLTPSLQKYGARLQSDLAGVYRSAWPRARMRVDVVYYANWAGAYSFVTPAQIALASMPDDRSAGWRKLELLFHEASHALVGQLDADIAAAAQRQGRAPEQLWHATLFFTTGEIVRRTLEKDGIADYVPYAYYNGLFAADGDWSSYARALEKHWAPYLSGNAGYEPALNALVEATTQPTAPQ